MKAGFVFFVSWEVFWAFLSAVIGQVMIKYIKELIEDAAAVELGQSLELSRCLVGYYVRRRSAVR